MFGFGINAVMNCLAEYKAREEWLSTMPEEKANKIREELAIKARERELHRRALEIAEAGRPRNFWGK